MSRFSNIKISKGGRLLADEWKYNKETKSGKMSKDIDITSNVLYYLHDECELEDGITLGDVLLFVDNINLYPFLSPLLTKGPWLKDIIDEGLSGEPSDDCVINNIVLEWDYLVLDDFYNKGEDLLSSYIKVNGHTEQNNETYALDFTPMYDLVSCTITLSGKLAIKDERAESLAAHNKYLGSLSPEKFNKELRYPVLLNTHKDFTLYDILYGLFWEFSFHGGPKDKSARRNELIERVEKIDSGEEKLIPWEEVKESLTKIIGDK